MSEEALVQVGLLVLTGIGALIAVSQARTATNAARDARRDASASRYERLAVEYASPEFAAAVSLIKHWKEGHDRRGEFGERIGDWATDAASERPSSAAVDLNKARRLVTHLLHRAAVLLAEGALEAAYAREVRAWPAKTVWRDAIKPMEMAYHTALGTPSVEAKRTIELIEREFFEKG